MHVQFTIHVPIDLRCCVTGHIITNMSRLRKAKSLEEEKISFEDAVPSSTKYSTKWACKVFAINNFFFLDYLIVVILMPELVAVTFFLKPTFSNCTFHFSK